MPYAPYLKWAVFLLCCAVVAWLVLFGPTWLHVIGGVILAGMLYFLRRRRRLLYGLVEVAAGIAALVSTYPAVRQTCGTFAETCQQIPLYIILLGMLTAVYILIRGFDNIAQGWSASTTGR
jgi:hypothetical protein